MLKHINRASNIFKKHRAYFLAYTKTYLTNPNYMENDNFVYPSTNPNIQKS